MEIVMKLLLVAFFQLLAMVEMACGVLLVAESGGVGVYSLIAVGAALFSLSFANEVSKS
jgi:hypothetical protein